MHSNGFDKKQFLILQQLGYGPRSAYTLLQRVGGAYQIPYDVELVLSGFKYESNKGNGIPDRCLKEVVQKKTCTCLEAALVAHDLVGLLGFRRNLLVLNRKNPTDGTYLGHAVLVYETPDGLLGAIGKSKYANQRGRPAEFITINDLATSYAVEYLALGLIPISYGSANLLELGMGLDWRRYAGDMATLHDRLVETQINHFNIEEIGS